MFLFAPVQYQSYLKTDPRGLTFHELAELATHIISLKSAWVIENAQQGNRGAIQINFDRLVFITSKLA